VKKKDGLKWLIRLMEVEAVMALFPLVKISKVESSTRPLTVKALPVLKSATMAEPCYPEKSSFS